MPSISSTALSGMGAAQLQLDASANNVANTDTPNYRRRVVQQTPQADGGVAARVTQSAQSPSLEADMVAQLQAKNAFLANLAVFKTADRMAGALLREKA